MVSIASVSDLANRNNDIFGLGGKCVWNEVLGIRSGVGNESEMTS